MTVLSVFVGTYMVGCILVGMFCIFDMFDLDDHGLNLFKSLAIVFLWPLWVLAYIVLIIIWEDRFV